MNNNYYPSRVNTIEVVGNEDGVYVLYPSFIYSRREPLSKEDLVSLLKMQWFYTREDLRRVFGYGF